MTLFSRAHQTVRPLFQTQVLAIFLQKDREL
jgi:hypothetical protein